MPTTINVPTGRPRTSSWRRVKMTLIDDNVNHCWIPVLTWRTRQPGIHEEVLWLMECDQSEPSCHKQRHLGWFGVLDPDSCISKRLLTPVCLHNVGGGAQLCGPAVDLLFLANLSQNTLLNSDVLIGLGQRIMTVMSYNLKWIQARHLSFFLLSMHCTTLLHCDCWLLMSSLCVCMEASSPMNSG